MPEVEPWIADWVRRNLTGYSGICNIELIGGQPIEAHLRGSNGFFDFYGPAFIPAWVALADGEPFTPPLPIHGGFVISVFGEIELRDADFQAAEAAGVHLQPDPSTPGRAAILRCQDRDAGFALYRHLTGHTL